MQAPSTENDPHGRLTILERIAAGEKSAVEECIKTYGGLVWKIARKHAFNNEDAEDAVQEIFTSIWMNAHRFDAEKSPESAFVCLLAKRKSIDLFRKHRRERQETELVETGGADKHAHDGHRNVLLNMDLKPVVEALRNLPEKENELIKSSIFNGNSHQEIADIFQIPLGTVKSKIRRGINKIRSNVGEPFLTDLHESYFG